MTTRMDDPCTPSVENAALARTDLDHEFNAGLHGENENQGLPYCFAPMPERSFSYLDARCQFALARVLLVVDRLRANRVAQQVWGDVVDMAHEVDAMESPWPLLGEPVLLKAFQLGLDLGRRQMLFREAGEARLVAWVANKQAQKEATLAAQLEDEAVAPSADSLLSRVRAGEPVELNGHSLEWDQEFEILAGTNPYGVDYYWGEMTVESLSRWRALMLRGETIGASPPYAEADDDDLPYLADPTPEEEELHLEYMALKSMSDWVLLPDLEGVVPADETNS